MDCEVARPTAAPMFDLSTPLEGGRAARGEGRRILPGQGHKVAKAVKASPLAFSLAPQPRAPPKIN